AGWTPERFAAHEAMPLRGIDSVTVPGAVAAWVELRRRFGTLPLSVLAEPAISYARSGFLVSPKIAKLWHNASAWLGAEPGFAEAFLPGGRAPKPGELFSLEPQARSLELIAQSNGEAFYQGELAGAMAAFSQQCGGVLTLDDLAAHTADWVDPVS